MPCTVEPVISNEQYLEHMLCQCCRYLTKEEICSVKGIDCYVDLYEWYSFHLLDDANYFEKKYINDDDDNLHCRIGLNQLDIVFKEEKLLRKEKELDRIKKELDRLGFELIIDDKSVGIFPYGRERIKDT